MAVSLEQFSRQLTESGVLSELDLRAFVDKLPAAERPADGEQLAKRLVKDKKISAYQAQVVYSGKGKSLTMGSYFVLDKLGQGGMGMVLKAEHQMMKRLVAIKVLSPTVTKTKELQQRFQREVQAAARLTHPNIVGAFDAGESNGSPFLVMEYVAGDDLSAIVRKKGPLTVDQAIDCITQAAKGLEFAHSQGVIHRDIKPANLLMDTKGVVKILDMGLARIEANDVATQADLTGTGAVMGTVDYMAPEQALSTKHADARSDLYSLGISLWYLLTGRSAYEGDSLMARLLAHRDQPIPSLRAARADASESLDRVFSKLVAKRQADRYQTAADLLVDLQACRTGASIKAVTVAEVETGPDEFQKFLQHIESPTEGPRGTRSNPSMTGTRTVTRPTRKVAGAEETMSHPNVGDTQRIRRQTIRKSKVPPWFQDWRWQIGGAAAAVILLLGAVFLFQTPDGTLRVEILDPEVEMKVKGTQLSFHGADLDPVSLKVGQKKLQVTRGDLVFDTESFEIKKGKETRVKVELTGDKLVVNGGGKVIAEQPIRQRALTTSTTGSNSVASTIPTSNTSAPLPAIAPFDAAQAKKHQEAWAAYLKLPVEYTNSIGMKFVLIPPGEFQMGCDEQEIEFHKLKIPFDDNGVAFVRIAGASLPKHTVRITRPFYMQAHEVTNGDYQKLLGELPAENDPTKPDSSVMQNISLVEATAFCDALSKKERKDPAYRTIGDKTTRVVTANGYRLPTEAEWEYACRAGTTTFWFFGDDASSNLLLDYQTFHRGGAAKPNPFGLIDIYGGSSEWCFDRLSNYTSDTVADPFTEPDGEPGVARGGTMFADIGGDRVTVNSVVRAPFRGHGFYKKWFGLGRVVLPIEWNPASGRPSSAVTPPSVLSGKLFMHDPAFGQWVKDVQAMPAEQQVEAVSKKLVELNPGFDGTVRLKNIENGVVTDFRVHSDDLKDVSPVRAFTGLKRLHLAGSSFGKGKLTDLSPLQGLKLEYFDCGWSDVVDFSPLVDVPLQVLNCGGTKVSDLTPLRNMRLTKLDCPQSQVSNLGPLKGMPLTELFLDSCPVSDFSPLKGMPLKKLRASNSKVTDLSHLEGMPLTELSLDSCPVSDLSPLKGMPLTILRVPNSKVANLSPVEGMPLEELNCNENPQISDLTPLKGLSLKTLGCKNTGVSDLSPARGMPLLYLEYDFKEPRDLEIIRPIKTLELINGKPAAEFWKEAKEQQKGK